MRNTFLLGRLLCLIFFTSFFFINQTYAQNTTRVRGGDAKYGMVRIKVDEETADYLRNATTSRSAEGYLKVGRQAFDEALVNCKASSMTRVFKPLNNAYEEKHRKHGLHLWYEVRFDKSTDVHLALQEFERMGSVAVSEPVYEKINIGYSNPAETFEEVTLASAPDDPRFVDQWHYNNTGQTGGTVDADIDLLEAWGVETGNSQVIVAVTDGGIDVAHEDLAANMWVNVNEIPGNGIDDDNNGYIDDINGYGFGDDSGTIPADAHGTHVGGTVAAVTNNGVGVSGVAGGDGSGDGVRLMSLAAFGQFNTGNFEGTYVYAADNGAVISQNSWGYTSPGVFEQVVLDAIDYFIAEAGFDAGGNPVGPMQGGLVVFAAGNDGSFSDYYPGFYDPVFAVGGTDHNDDEYTSSNRGDWVDIAAPAVGVLSSLPGNSYGSFNGTSMACPHVSGVAGLIVSRNLGSITPDQVRFLIEETADPLPGLEFLGAGRVNAFAALQFNDGAAPDDIVDLSVADLDLSSVTLSWTAPADAGSANASTYDIRYSTSLIDAGNFDAATPVASPPLASPAGTTETFTVTGLTSATEYYFAIKSADFFGNISGISNVVNATTDEPPVAGVSPASLTSDLITGESEVQLLTISNSGLGPLDFNISFDSADFLSANIISGTVAPSGSQQIEITFDASGLFGGTYVGDVIVSTNDPSAPTFNVPATLNVTGTGTPVIAVNPDSLIFSTLFVGASETLTFTVSNEGTEILDVTNISSTSVDFSVTSDTAFSILPFESQEVSVEFSPTALGSLFGSIIIDNNDTQQAVGLFGQGVEPPIIDVTPGSLSAELVSGDVQNSELIITNNGVADLTFEIEITEPGEGTTAVTMDFSAKAIRTSSSTEGVKQPTSSNFAGMRMSSEVSILAGTVEVLLLTPDDDISDLESALSAFPDLNVTRFPEASLPGITLADVSSYDVIVTTNNTQWFAGGNVSPVVVGDLLADFIDQGGKVIANSFAYDYDAWALEGRFIDENYGPFSGTSTDFSGSVSLGTIHAPSHPIMNGVTSITNGYLWQNPSLAAGATLLADWSDGNHFAAANDNVVALNILPSDGAGVPGWTGDLATLYHNAIGWLSGPSFVSVDVESGVLSMGDTAIVNVAISAAGLDAGLFEADINVTSNDPANSAIQVPVSLTVLGPPVEASPASFDVTLEKGETTTETLTLTNNSKTDATYDISIQNVSNSGVEVSLAPVPLVPRTEAFAGTLISANSFAAISSGVAQLATDQYATGFEDFAIGDINGQQGWVGQFGNWAINTSNASEGSQSMESLSDGLGQTLAFSPEVPAGVEPFSSVSASVEIQGGGVTWEIIPQSNTDGFVNTRLRFNGNGTIDVLVSDGVGGSAFEIIPATIPTGYFKVGIEVERATSQFTIYIDEVAVYSALGFAGDIEQLVLLSAMESFGPTFFMDELQIIDGGIDAAAPFVSVDPSSGIIPTGSSIDLEVTFDATEQEFGVQTANIVVEVNDGAEESVIVPATLNVVGDPAIAVDPTVVIETVDYDKPSTRIVSIENIGGNPLNYDLTVFGADATTTAEGLTAQLTKKRSFDSRISAKMAEDNRLSAKNPKDKPSTTQYITVGTPIFTEDFEGGTFPPAGWTTVDNEGSGVVWAFAADYGDGNYCGTGEAATINSDAFGPAEFDAELITPAIDIAGKSSLALKYNVNYQNLANLDFLDVDVSTDGGTTWVTVLSWNEDHGTFFGTPGESVDISLDSVVAGASEMMIRWHYYDPNSGDWDWYAQIDDVEIVENNEVWLAVDNTVGTVAVGETAEVELQFDPTVVDPGLYVAGIIVNSNAANTPVVGVVAAMQELNPAIISTSTNLLEEELVAGRKSTQTLTISNSGESALDFAFEDNFPNVGEAPSDSTLTTSTVEKPEPEEVDLTGSKAFVVSNALATLNAVELPVNFSDVLYATNFEDFDEGDINGQQGWVGQFANWQIETTNPAGGEQHVSSLSDGLGQTLAFSPEVPVGIESISSTSMMVDFEGADVTWQIIPQSNSQGFVVTRLSFDPDGTVSVLVDSADADFVTIGAIPEGPFEVKIEAERATSRFSVYFDGIEVFAGQGFAGSVEQVVLFSLMEVEGPTMDIDNLQIVDGVIPELPVSASPAVGTIPSGESLDVSIAFDATNLLGGVREETLVINSNDPESPEVEVETILTIIDPQVIAVDPDSMVTSVAYQGMKTETLTITNDGVADLIFHIDIGEELTIPGTTEHQLSTSKDWQSDSRIVQKLAQDDPIAADVSNSSLVDQRGLVAVVNEGFESGTFPPSGWSVVDNESSGVAWVTASDLGEGNYTGGTGEAAMVSSDAAGVAEFDTELISPSIDVNGQTGLTLQYDVNYQNFASSDFFDVDITTDGGVTWTTMLSWNEDHGGFFSAPGEVVTIDLDPYLVGATSFNVRWHYYDPNSGDWDWYVQIDNVVIGVPWLSISQAADTLGEGESVDIEVTFDASLLESGYYPSNLSICSNDLRNPQVDVPVLLYVQTPPSINFEPEALEAIIEEDREKEEIFAMFNSGESPLEFNLISVPDFVDLDDDDDCWDWYFRYYHGGGYGDDDDDDDDGEDAFNGVLPGGETQEFIIELDADDLEPGTYVDSMVFETNDPLNPTAAFVIELVVVEKLRFIVAPNPFRNRLFLIMGRGMEQTHEVSIYDLQGNLMYQNEVVTNPYRRKRLYINTSGFKRGMYELVIRSENGLVKTRNLYRR